MKTAISVFSALTIMHSIAQTPPAAHSTPVFAISFDSAKSGTPLDGRLLLMFSTDPAEEPRLQINDGLKTQIVFGMDVETWKPGEPRTMDAANGDIFGHPIRSLHELKPGEYIVQALLDRYETFHRADGHVLKLPTDRG